MTFTWWGFILFFVGLGAASSLIGKYMERWTQHRKTR